MFKGMSIQEFREYLPVKISAEHISTTSNGKEDFHVSVVGVSNPAKVIPPFICVVPAVIMKNL